MENKQTAVDWLLKEINERNGFIFTIYYEELFNQAKAMEKWQIVNAHFNGGEIFNDNGKLVTGEMYYEETYGK